MSRIRSLSGTLPSRNVKIGGIKFVAEIKGKKISFLN